MYAGMVRFSVKTGSLEDAAQGLARGSTASWRGTGRP